MGLEGIRSWAPGPGEADFREGSLQIPSDPQPPRVAGWWIMAESSFLIEPSTSVSASNSREHELMQYLLPVGLGPSSKMWPRWDPQFLQVTSVRISSGFLMMSKRLPPTEKYNFCIYFELKIIKVKFLESPIFFFFNFFFVEIFFSWVKRWDSGDFLIKKNLLPDASALKVTLALSMTSKKEGQPEPESYFVLDKKRLVLQTLQL